MKNKLKEWPIEGLNIPYRAYNPLLSYGITNVYEIVTKTEAQLLRIKCFGRKSFNLLKNELMNHGLKLGMTGDEIYDFENCLIVSDLHKALHKLSKGAEELKVAIDVFLKTDVLPIQHPHEELKNGQHQGAQTSHPSK